MLNDVLDTGCLGERNTAIAKDCLSRGMWKSYWIQNVKYVFSLLHTNNWKHRSGQKWFDLNSHGKHRQKHRYYTGAYSSMMHQIPLALKLTFFLSHLTRLLRAAGNYLKDASPTREKKTVWGASTQNSKSCMPKLYVPSEMKTFANSSSGKF